MLLKLAVRFLLIPLFTCTKAIVLRSSSASASMRIACTLPEWAKMCCRAASPSRRSNGLLNGGGGGGGGKTGAFLISEHKKTKND
ncbi:hypothetical protein TYRP_011695 [Tyrophagus putrescentiae]|nr:hypothetical protein TYRP_011695 [Tyrophagus putrescentiae]